MSQPFRLSPALAAQHMKTYEVACPKPTHFRPATCEEAECAHMTHGWASTIDETTDLGQRQAHYIRKQSGRKFKEERNEVGLTVFTFEAGQTCFRKHQVPLERPPLFLLKGGDWRGNPLGTPVRQFDNPDHWIDDFAQHQDRISDAQKKG